MQRSLIVILLSIVCGASAAIGVNQLSPRAERLNVETRPVFVAATPIRRGAKVVELDITSVDWPVNLIPEGVVTLKEQAVGRSALTGISTNEPLMTSKLSESAGSGFASNTIPQGMRACSIQTNGPSASVAGFVRPGDRVDVLLNLRGNSRDETGGGSTITLLQSAEILAIDDIMDVDASTVKMWMKEGIRSVTLLVTPEQALQLSLGQSAGTVSLALRNANDRNFITDTKPVTINQVRNMPAADTYALQAFLSELQGSKFDPAADALRGEAEANDVDAIVANSVEAASSPRSSIAANSPAVGPTRGVGEGQSVSKDGSRKGERKSPRSSYIYTLRGDQSGLVRVLEIENSRP